MSEHHTSQHPRIAKIIVEQVRGPTVASDVRRSSIRVKDSDGRTQFGRRLERCTLCSRFMFLIETNWHSLDETIVSCTHQCGASCDMAFLGGLIKDLLGGRGVKLDADSADILEQFRLSLSTDRANIKGRCRDIIQAFDKLDVRRARSQTHNKGAYIFVDFLSLSILR